MQQETDSDELLVFIKWLDFLEWLLPTTDKFPKKVRFSFALRIDNIALDIVEDLIEARYSKDKTQNLKRANLRLEKLRVLLRLSHKMKFLSHTGYEHASRLINEVGKMIGGWRKQQEKKC
jgi:hypothetical protein